MVLCPMPVNAMFVAPGSSEDVCGATMESWRDQIETIGGASRGAATSSAVSHALSGRSCDSEVPKNPHA